VIVRDQKPSHGTPASVSSGMRDIENASLRSRQRSLGKLGFSIGEAIMKIPETL
jgi:hypothetical protein